MRVATMADWWRFATNLPSDWPFGWRPVGHEVGFCNPRKLKGLLEAVLVSWDLAPIRSGAGTRTVLRLI